MVPWLVNRQGIDLQQAADDLGVSVEQLEADLNLLFLCGYGQLPDELIEADWEEDRVFVGNADTIARPFRELDDPVPRIAEMLAGREPLYRLADVSIPTDGRSPESIAFELETVVRMRALAAYAPPPQA